MAVLLAGILAFIFFTIGTFTSLLNYFLYSITVWFLGWLVLGIAAMLFPYRRKDIFQKSPAIVQRKVLGIPLISILGLITAVVSVVTVYVTIVPAFTGTVQLLYLGGTVITLAVIPFILYFAAYRYHKSKGVPMDLQFKEVPPD